MSSRRRRSMLRVRKQKRYRNYYVSRGGIRL